MFVSMKEPCSSRSHVSLVLSSSCFVLFCWMFCSGVQSCDPPKLRWTDALSYLWRLRLPQPVWPYVLSPSRSKVKPEPGWFFSCSCNRVCTSTRPITTIVTDTRWSHNIVCGVFPASGCLSFNIQEIFHAASLLWQIQHGAPDSSPARYYHTYETRPLRIWPTRLFSLRFNQFFIQSRTCRLVPSAGIYSLCCSFL